MTAAGYPNGAAEAKRAVPHYCGLLAGGERRSMRRGNMRLALLLTVAFALAGVLAWQQWPPPRGAAWLHRRWFPRARSMRCRTALVTFRRDPSPPPADNGAPDDGTTRRWGHCVSAEDCRPRSSRDHLANERRQARP